MPVIEIIDKPLHPAQLQVEAEAKRFNVLGCGRRFGKTDFGAHRVVKVALAQRKPYGWFAPNYKYLLDAWRRIRETLSPAATRVSETDKRIELLGGGSVDFWTLEDQDAGRGYKYGEVTVDEAAKVRYLMEAWTKAIRPTLADLRGSAFFLSTPRGNDDFHELWRRGQDPTFAEWASWRFPTGANPYISEDEIADMERDMPPHAYRQEVLAEFIDTHGVYVQREWFEDRYDELPNLKRWVRAYDPAFTEDGDYSASMLGGINEKGKIVVADVQRVRTQAPDVRQLILDNVKRDPPGTAVILETAHSGLAIFQDLRRDPVFLRTPLLDYKPAGRDKLQRAAGWLAAASQGRILLPQFAPWVEPYLSELLDFRNEKTDVDDQWDATTILFEGLYQTMGGTVPDRDVKMFSAEWWREVHNANSEEEDDEDDD